MRRLPILAFLFVSLSVLGTSWTTPAVADEAAKSRVVSPPGPGLPLPFSPAMAAGDFLYLSGAIANEPGKTTVDGDAKAQMKKTMENLGAVLKADGLDFSRVVAADVFLSDIRHFGVMNEVYGTYFADGKRPARTTIEADIAIPNAITEVGMIAARAGVEMEWIVPEGWPVSSSFSWGVRAGDTLFLSGLVSSDPAGGGLVLGEPTVAGFKTQLEQTLKNVDTILKAAGMTKKNVVGCRVYLPDPRDYNVMNDVYGAYFNEEPRPVRATVRARLANPALRIEVTCTAMRGERKAVTAANAAPSTRPFSAGIQVGDQLFLSGMVGRGPDGYPAGIEAQTRVTLDRLKATMDAAGLDFRDVVSASVFLTDARHYQAMNKIYAEVVGTPPPARATVGTPLMSPDALVEIQMTAVRRKD